MGERSHVHPAILTQKEPIRGRGYLIDVIFQDDRVISGSATGVVKVWDIRDNSLKPVMSSDQAPVDQADAGVTIKPRRVRCLATTEETVYWGDDGVNIKAMDLNSGTGMNNDSRILLLYY